MSAVIGLFPLLNRKHQSLMLKESTALSPDLRHRNSITWIRKGAVSYEATYNLSFDTGMPKACESISALYSMNSAVSVRERAFGQRTGTAAAALAEMIREGQFLLSEAELVALEQKDDLLAGWVFAYRASQLTGDALEVLLLKGLRAPNPRIREQSCDLIGDKRIIALREELPGLFNDSVAFVLEAAWYNYEILAV